MAALPACANCGTALNGPFCSNCGQKATDLHRPIWWIIGEFLDAVFSYDSRTFRTIWLLFSEPGEFTRRYLEGKRASLLPPFRLLVIATIGFFLILQITDMAIIAFKTRPMTQAEINDIKRLSENAANADPGVRRRFGPNTVIDTKSQTVVDIEFFVPAASIQHVKLTPQQKKTILPVRVDKQDELSAEDADWLKWIERNSAAVSKGYERALEDPMKLNAPLNVWLPRLMIVLVPIFALLLAVLHWWPRVYLSEHLIFSVHVHTVIFIALSLMALSSAFLGSSSFLGAIMLILAVYLWMAMYRVYHRSWWLTSIKFVAVLFVYSIIMSIGLSMVFILALAEL